MNDGGVHVLRQRHRVHHEATNGHVPGIDEEELREQNERDSTSSSQSSVHSVSHAERARLSTSTPEALLAFHERSLEKRLVLVLLAIRIVNALLTSRTIFAPDEHWQSLEIAHGIVFGSGYKTWEWRDRRPAGKTFWGAYWGDGPIRTILYPAVFVPMYWILKVLRLDETILLALAPGIIQAVFATVTDAFQFKLAKKLVNERTAWMSVFLSAVSMYTFHTTTRTLSNSVEATLTVTALYYWPLSIPENIELDLVGEHPLVAETDFFWSVSFFALATALRPSNVLLSAPLVFLIIQRISHSIHSAGTALEAGYALLVMARVIVFVGSAALALLLFTDSLYHGRLTLTPLSFLKKNVLEGVSLFYGASPLHFYLSSALPFISFTLMPYTLWGIMGALTPSHLAGFSKASRRWYGIRGEQDPAALRVLAKATVFFVLSMSFLGHKEVRFLQPIVPVLHVLTAYALTSLPRLSWSAVRTYLPSRNPTGEVQSENQDQEIIQQARSDRSQREGILEALSIFTSWRTRQHLLPDPASFKTTVHSLCQPFRFILERHGRIVALLVLSNVLPIIYLAIHSRGQVLVTEEIGRLNRQGSLESIGFLMPCHSTPWQSHMHAPKLNEDSKAWFITCEPPLDGQNLDIYHDESDNFYADPYDFLLHLDRPWPSHLALFGSLLHETSQKDKIVEHQSVVSSSSLPSNETNVADLPSIYDLLARHGYTVLSSYWNSLVHLDRRRRGRVILMRKATDNL